MHTPTRPSLLAQYVLGLGDRLRRTSLQRESIWRTRARRRMASPTALAAGPRVGQRSTSLGGVAAQRRSEPLLEAQRELGSSVIISGFPTRNQPARRRIVGWSMAEHMRTELVVDALGMAIAPPARGAGPDPPLRPGIPYVSLAFGQVAARGGHRPLDGFARRLLR